MAMSEAQAIKALTVLYKLLAEEKGMEITDLQIIRKEGAA